MPDSSLVTFLRPAAFVVAGAVALFLIFGAPVLVAMAFGAGDMAPMFMLAVPMTGLIGYACYLAGELLVEIWRD